MKKAKNRLIAILLLFLLSSSSFILYNNVEKNASNSLIQDINSPKLSTPGKSLLHSYDFEDETIGQDPTYESLTIDESSGDVYIDDLSDGQQKHLALHKVGTSGRVWVRDNFSRFGETYTAGEYHLKVYHDASGFGINLNSANGEYILAMVWDDGEIRDDVGGTLLATYAYDQWLDVVIYFNLSLGWMFDLEGVRYGAGYSYSFFGPFTANAEHIWITSFVSGGGDGYFRIDDIAFYYETENLINIFTPEAKEYRKPMDGYYPATYGFENDKYGEQAQGWWTENEANCDSQIIDNYKGHNNVYELYDNSGSAKADVINNFENKTYGTIELWFQLGTSNYHAGIVVGFREPYKSKISFQISPGSNLLARNGTVLIAMPEFGIMKADSWYHLRFDFRAEGAPYYMGLSEDSYMVYLNGTKANSELSCNPIESGFPFNSLQFSTGGGFSPDYLIYFDAIGYSWDPNYQVGDNLYEGLLLSYKNSTSLDWIGYSLDGQLNKTILGNTTIPMPEDGIHSIQVFGNDSLGDMYHSDLRYFTVDFPIDIITPEAKIYEKGMSGYYPATYGFENDKPGEFPEDWYFTPMDGSSFIEVDATLAGHNNVVEVRKTGGTIWAQCYNNFNENQTTGIVEFWLYKDTGSGGDYTLFNLVNTLGPNGHLQGQIESQNFYYHTGTATQRVLVASNVFSINTWHHIRLFFNVSQGWQAEIDGVMYGSGYSFPFRDYVTGGAMKQFYISSVFSGGHSDYGAWFDAVGYSWDPNYNIGDNLNEGLLLSYENSTALDWQGYSLDNQPIKTILGNCTIPLPSDGPSDGLHTIQIFGNDSFGTEYQSSIREFSVYHINIITPEDKTYTEPMSGYYPGTYGFENDKIGSLPSFGHYFDLAGGKMSVIEELDGHHHILELNDNNSASRLLIVNNITATPTHGTIEFWMRTNDTSKLHSYNCVGDNLIGATAFLQLKIENDVWRYTDYTVITDVPNVPIPQNNTWHKISIHFRCGGAPAYQGLSDNKWKIIIDGVDSGELNPRGTTHNYLTHFNIKTEFIDEGYSVYIDGVGYSWDPNYNIGDNLKQGLLLSYENSTALDWQGYSLDGQPKNTIMGNTTIPFPAVGQHAIQVFANDSLGLNYNSDIRYFSVNTTQSTDLINPIITINFPGLNDLFGSGAPSYDITVIELNLNTMWYTLDWGLINTSITEPTGTIDQTIWNSRPNGTVDIRFYADDIAGNVGFEEVTVRKDILPPQITITNPIQNQVFDDTAPSFDLTISEGNLDARWYSLDGGATAIQFIGFAGTINQTEWDKITDGTATITFYANDTLNNLGFSEVSVRKDTIEPQITINSPSPNQIFYEEAPSFDLTIVEQNLDAIWYTLDDGLITFLCGTSGNINNLYWNAIPPGFYILKFYTNDTVGNIGFSEVTIKKEDPAIPGYNPFVLSLILLVGILGISLKIKKKAR